MPWPLVTTHWPVSHPPWYCSNSFCISGPPLSWICLSIPPPFFKEQLAALTIASHLMFRMSPSCKCICRLCFSFVWQLLWCNFRRVSFCKEYPAQVVALSKQSFWLFLADWGGIWIVKLLNAAAWPTDTWLTLSSVMDDTRVTSSVGLLSSDIAISPLVSIWTSPPSPLVSIWTSPPSPPISIWTSPPSPLVSIWTSPPSPSVSKWMSPILSWGNVSSNKVSGISSKLGDISAWEPCSLMFGFSFVESSESDNNIGCIGWETNPNDLTWSICSSSVVVIFILESIFSNRFLFAFSLWSLKISRIKSICTELWNLLRKCLFLSNFANNCSWPTVDRDAFNSGTCLKDLSSRSCSSHRFLLWNSSEKQKRSATLVMGWMPSSSDFKSGCLNSVRFASKYGIEIDKEPALAAAMLSSLLSQIRPWLGLKWSRCRLFTCLANKLALSENQAVGGTRRESNMSPPSLGPSLLNIHFIP